MANIDNDDFVFKIDNFFSESKEKNTINFSFKRVYQESNKFKKSKNARNLREIDCKNQESDTTKQYNVLVRAKLRRKRIRTIVDSKNIRNFHSNLMKIFTLHFITQTNDHKPRIKVSAKKKRSNKQKRKDKKEKKLLKKINNISINTNDKDNINKNTNTNVNTVLKK